VQSQTATGVDFVFAGSWPGDPYQLILCFTPQRIVITAGAASAADILFVSDGYLYQQHVSADTRFPLSRE
jgi:hypothetical protein